jgi:hypothetical protein
MSGLRAVAFLLASVTSALAGDPRETVDWLTQRAIRQLEAEDRARQRTEPKPTPDFGAQDKVVKDAPAPTICNTVRIDSNLTTTVCD